MKYIQRVQNKISCRYLLWQYKNSLDYLKKELNYNPTDEHLNLVCERVIRAGTAYAQAKHCFF